MPIGKIGDVVGGALIGAVGSLGGAALQSRAAGRATEAQERSTAAALAFEREREAEKKAMYERDLQRYDASRQILAQRYGISLPPLGGPAQAPPGGAVPRQGAPRPPMAQPRAPQAGVMGQGAGTIASLVAPQQQAAQPGTIRSLGGWNDWRQQGLVG